MNAFFRPPSEALSRTTPFSEAPRWTGRPSGTPPGAVIEHQLLVRSETSEVEIAYLDAFPDGFELQIAVRSSLSWDLLRRPGDGSADIFGRHWPMVSEPKTVLPPQLLRLGIQYADNRSATTIAGFSSPRGGPVISELIGGGQGGTGGSRFQQGYWLTPLPPPGPVTVTCEWPAGDIPLTHIELDGQAIIDAAAVARSLFSDSRHVQREGRTWRLGGETEMSWILDGFRPGREITSSIPAIFGAYCTLAAPDQEDLDKEAILDVLNRHTLEQPWWLGYLDTGASDVVFPYAPRVAGYVGWQYVLVEAGPEQAAQWREAGFNTAMPDILFPADRSWLLSTGWDNTWTCLGGPVTLIDAFISHPTLGSMTRRVSPDEDATPPGHTAI